MKSSFFLWVASAVLLSSGIGCGSCASEESSKQPAETQGSGSAGASKNKEKLPPGARNITKDGPRFGHMLLVGLEDEKAHLWVEGETKSQRRNIPDTRYSASGFEWDEGQTVKVLGSGGGIYIRMGEPNLPALPVSELISNPGAQPDGFEVQSTVTRNGMYQTFLRIGAHQKLKLGPMAKTEHLSEVWMTGEPPPGISSIALDPAKIWPREDGIPQAVLPEGAEVIQSAATKEQEAIWLADIAVIRDGEVTLRQSLVADVDRDEEPEGAICVNGGRGDYNCYLVDMVGTERRYYGIYIGRYGEAPLMAFSMDGGSYIGWVGRLNRSTAETDAPQIHVVRFDGGGYPTNFYK